MLCTIPGKPHPKESHAPVVLLYLMMPHDVCEGPKHNPPPMYMSLFITLSVKIPDENAPTEYGA